MNMMTNLPAQQSRLGEAVRIAAQSRMRSETLHRASPGAVRVPLSSEGRVAAFVCRTTLADAPPRLASEALRAPSADRRVERAIAAQWQAEAGTPPARIGISATGGIVRLAGTVETVHDRMALCRIAAATDETMAIVDDLWVACE